MLLLLLMLGYQLVQLIFQGVQLNQAVRKYSAKKKNYLYRSKFEVRRDLERELRSLLDFSFARQRIASSSNDLTVRL